MIRRTTVLAAACGFVLAAFQGPASAGVLDPWLENGRLEAGTDEEREALSRGLVETGRAGVRELVGELSDPGTGDDTNARMALHAMAYYVSRPGAEADRRMFAGVLAGELEAGDGRSAEVKGYLIRMLRLAGGRESVEVLGKLLLAGGVGERAGADIALSEYAAQALLSVRHGATAQFRKALPKVRGPARLTILQALGVMRDRKSVPDLLKAARDRDREVRLAALWGLGNIGDPAAVEVLLRAAPAESRYERARATDALLLLARRLSERDRRREIARFVYRWLRRSSAPRGRPLTPSGARFGRFAAWRGQRRGPDFAATMIDASILVASQFARPAGRRDAERIYRRLWDGRTDPLDRHVRCAALQGLARVLGAKAFDQLRAAMQSDDIEIRAVATEAAIMTPGRDFTLRWIDELRTGAPEARPGTLEILGRRGDRAALPVILEAMKGASEEVQLAAIDAVAALGGTGAVRPLVKLLGSENEGERKNAKLALQRMSGFDVTRAIAGSIKGARAGAKCALLEVLAARGGRDYIEEVFACTKDADGAVRAAALGALGRLADERSLPSLIGLLLGAADSRERRAAEKSVETVCVRLADKDACVSSLLASLRRAGVQAKCSLLRVLGRVGGPRALDAVRSATRDANSEIKDAAIRSLADWPDASAADDLLAIARRSSDRVQKVIALRGYVRAVGLPSDRPAVETLALYKGAMRVATRPEEKKLVLAGLAGVNHLDALAMADRYMDDPTYREEAAAAAVKIARAVSGEHKDRAMAALRKVLEVSKSGGVRNQANEAIDHIERFNDYVTAWMVSGPYMKQGKGGQALFKVPFPPEEPGGKAKWQLWTGSGNEPWRVNISGIKGIGGDNRVAYLRAQVRPPEAQEVLLELGSDDGIKVWLNGEVVHSKDVMRGFREAEDKVKVRMKDGWNTLLLKINNGGGDFSGACRVRAADGKKLKGLAIRAE